MKLLILCFSLLALVSPAYASKTKKSWYKVETKQQPKTKKDQEKFFYDSLDKQDYNRKFSETGFWSLRPKLRFAGGFHADSSVFEDSETDRLFFETDVYFRNKPTSRIAGSFMLLQNNTFFLGGEWQRTKSRKAVRFYYGVGLALGMNSDKQLSNLVDLENYYITGSYGREALISPNTAWSVELKAFAGTTNYALQILFGYIITI